MIRDRRQRNDRRTDVRYVTQINIQWENSVGKQSGIVSDISETGCFVLCSGAVRNGETIKLYFPTGPRQNFELSGEIVTHDFEIGYSARFIEIGELERLFLEHLINSLEKKVVS